MGRCRWGGNLKQDNCEQEADQVRNILLLPFSEGIGREDAPTNPRAAMSPGTPHSLRISSKLTGARSSVQKKLPNISRQPGFFCNLISCLLPPQPPKVLPTNSPRAIQMPRKSVGGNHWVPLQKTYLQGSPMRGLSSICFCLSSQLGQLGCGGEQHSSPSFGSNPKVLVGRGETAGHSLVPAVQLCCPSSLHPAVPWVPMQEEWVLGAATPSPSLCSLGAYTLVRNTRQKIA